MTNLEFYKTKEAVTAAFAKICTANVTALAGDSGCGACPYQKKDSGEVSCIVNFMFAEHKEAPKVPRRRPFDAEEIESVVGSCVCIPATETEFGRRLLVLGSVEKREDGKSYGPPEVLIAGFHFGNDFVSWCDQEELIRKGATLDGVPWGVEVTEAKS